jgi:hypothetical protein
MVYDFSLLHGFDNQTNHERKIIVNNDGHMKTEPSLATGAASSENQLLNHTKLDTLSSNMTNGTHQVKVMALSTDGTQEQIGTDNNNNVKCNVVSAVSVYPHGSANGEGSPSTSFNTKDTTTHTKLDTLANNIVNNTVNQTNGLQQVKVMALSTDGTQEQIGTDNNNNVKCNVINSVNIQPANSSNAEMTPTMSFNVKDTTVHTKLDTINTTQTDGTNAVKCMGINDSAANQQIKTDNSGNVSAFLVSDVVMKPSNITNGDHGSFSGSSVASMMRARTNISDSTTGVFLKGNSLGSLIVDEAPPIYPTQTSLGNAARLNDGLFSGLTDVIDMEGFRSLAVTVLLTGNSGQTPLSSDIYFYASFDNTTFFNTGSFGSIVEATEGGASGEYKTFKFASNFGARYIKLGANLGFGNVTDIVVNYVRFNGGF